MKATLYSLLAILLLTKCLTAVAKCGCGCPEKEFRPHVTQVANALGMKWSSQIKKPGDTIKIVSTEVGKVTKQIWMLKREVDAPLWSFHLKSQKGEKLYLSYNAFDSTDQDVTLEIYRWKNIYYSKQKARARPKPKLYHRFFEAVLLPGEGILLRPPFQRERILGVKNGKLAMLNAKSLTDDMKWTVAIDPEGFFGNFEEPDCDIKDDCLTKRPTVRRRRSVSRDSPNVVQIVDASQSRKWISSSASIGDRVLVDMSYANQEWAIQGQSTGVTFRAVNSKRYYVSGDMTFEGGASNYRRKFRILTSNNPPWAFHIRASENLRYVGTDWPQPLLELKQYKAYATAWSFVQTRFTLAQNVIYPPRVSPGCVLGWHSIQSVTANHGTI